MTRPQIALTDRRTWAAAGALALALLAAAAPPGRVADAGSWRTDPAWHQGKAEWALYDATRSIYNADRHYEATIFTNKQHQDPETTTKASDWQAPDAKYKYFEVFKHNVSEMIPTENYTYRFITTAFVRADNLFPFKIAASSQEDCGTTYRQFICARAAVEAQCFSYFPDEGASTDRYLIPENLAFHDALTLTLRDYPFDAPDKPVIELQLVPDQTHNHATPLRLAPAIVRYIGRETINVPYGDLDTHHLRVEHAEMGGTTRSDYWFAADVNLRHVLARYEGPYGVRYRLKRLDWWAYWQDPRPE